MGFLNGEPVEEIIIEAIHWQMMLSDINSRLEEESCGLVAGINQRSMGVFPVTNVLHSPVRYKMDPAEQLEIFNHIDDKSWDLLAIYHSHLAGPSGPSHIDIIEATYPGVIYIIWSKPYTEWICQGYRIAKNEVEQVLVHLIGWKES